MQYYIDICNYLQVFACSCILKTMIVAVDIGGTKTLLAVFDTNMNLVQKVKFATPTENYGEFLAALKNA